MHTQLSKFRVNHFLDMSHSCTFESILLQSHRLCIWKLEIKAEQLTSLRNHNRP
jgi:hypothetical protein